MQWHPSATSRVPHVTLAALMVVSVIVASLGATEPPSGPGRGIASKVTGNTSVLGTAWKVDNTPIPGAQVQLRNVLTGKVEAKAIADNVGQFTFPQVEGGTYVVELIGENGKVVTVGHTFVVGQGETVATFVRLGTKTPFLPGFFSNAASAVTAIAASQGITAIAPVQIPASSGNPKQ